MIIRPLREDEKKQYDQVVHHPLQTWQWGEFRKKTGVKVERLGFFDQGELKHAMQVTFHKLPKVGFTVGYYPRGFQPDKQQLSALKQLGQKRQALFIKLEPNLAVKVQDQASFKQLAKFLIEQGCEPGRPLFTKHTFQVDLTPTEKELFANLKSKTRYNVRLATKKGVKIIEDSSRQGLDTYLDILQETIDRQGFYAHSPEYFNKMWSSLKDTGMMKLFHAVYDNQTLASWIIFKQDSTLYYPYGSSRAIHRDTMASNLLMWEVMMWGKRQGCTTFDMWGALGPAAPSSHPWHGFHRFKEGYGGDLMRFIGTYDLVLNEPLYRLFRIADDLRWKYLRLKTKFSSFFNQLPIINK